MSSPLATAHAAALRVNNGLPLFIVYNKPRDFPDRVVVRLFVNEHPTQSAWTFDTIEHARQAIPEGLYRLDRSPNDDARIVEVWL